MIAKILNSANILINLVGMTFAAFNNNVALVVFHGMLCLVSIGWIIINAIEEEK